MTSLADHCAKAGLSVTVLADRIRRPSPGLLPEKAYPIIRFGGPRPWRREQKRIHLLRVMYNSSAPIDGIFADSWKSVEAIPRYIDTPISVLAHGSEYPLATNGRKARRIREALSRCTSVVANSNFTKELVIPYLDGDSKRLSVLYPPSSPLMVPGQADLSWVANGLGKRRPVITTIARLEPRKGIDAVIRALPVLRLHHPDCVYAIAGAGADRDRLVEIARSLNVQDAVLFLGQVSDGAKAALLANSDVFAMPVRREGASVEGFGLSYSEAAWFGVPSLGGSGSGAAEAILHGETGLICDGKDQRDVTQCLLELLGDPGFRRQLGAAAKQRAETEISWDDKIGRYLATLGLAAI